MESALLRRTFRFVIFACLWFLMLTGLAMLAYPGGAHQNKHSIGYSFFTNFFSDLGRTVAHNGAPNSISASLFFAALCCAGTALVAFFIGFSVFFGKNSTVSKGFAWLGSVFGVIAGLCFIGVAFTPANLAGAAHNGFVFSAFRTFLLAVFIYVFVILFDGGFPRWTASIFVIFTGLLIAYLVLLTSGPALTSKQGVLIQATGQKIIVYASIVSNGIQSIICLRQLSKALVKA
jgi:hypothetical protein